MMILINDDDKRRGRNRVALRNMTGLKGRERWTKTEQKESLLVVHGLMFKLLKKLRK